MRYISDARLSLSPVIARSEATKQSQKNMKEHGYVYLMTNKANSVLYTGITSDLVKRVYEHKNKVVEGFTKKYNITKLVYYEMFDGIKDAIQREKQIKSGSRQKKLDLILKNNPEFKDIYSDIL